MQSRAFPSCRTAAQMRQKGGEKDQRRYPKRGGILRSRGPKNRVGAFIVIYSEQMVGKYRQNPCGWKQQEKEPRKMKQSGRQIYKIVEGCPRKAAYDAEQDGNSKPF